MILIQHWNCRWFPLVLALGLGGFVGCGDTGPTGGPTASETPAATPTGLKPAGEVQLVAVDALPPAPAANPFVDDDEEPEEDSEDIKMASLESGTPEWLIHEIVKIRVQPFPAAEIPADADEATRMELSRDQLEKQKLLRKERNEAIVKLATEALAKTMKDPAKEQLFTAAVKHLLDARLQLALAGDEESINALYEAALVFAEKSPGTEAAAQAAFTLTSFAHTNALRYTSTEPKWLTEFSRQAQLFARKFPKEQARSLPLLLAAAQSCELNGQPQEARACYRLIQANFPESSQAQQTAGISRRMELAGKPIELAGPTLDGNFLTIDDFKGSAVMVVFWSTSSKPFLEQLPKLQAITKKYEKHHLSVIGVCLDTEEPAIDAFLEEQGLGWTNIFYAEKEKRGWNSPLAQYYGISSLPTIWLVGADSTVLATDLTATTAEPVIRDELLKIRERLKAQPAK